MVVWFGTKQKFITLYCSTEALCVIFMYFFYKLYLKLRQVEQYARCDRWGSGGFDSRAMGRAVPVHRRQGFARMSLFFVWPLDELRNCRPVCIPTVVCCTERAGQAPADIPQRRAAGLARIPHHLNGLAAPRPSVHHQDAAQGNSKFQSSTKFVNLSSKKSMWCQKKLHFLACVFTYITYKYYVLQNLRT